MALAMSLTNLTLIKAAMKSVTPAELNAVPSSKLKHNRAPNPIARKTRTFVGMMALNMQTAAQLWDLSLHTVSKNIATFATDLETIRNGTRRRARTRVGIRLSTFRCQSLAPPT